MGRRSTKDACDPGPVHPVDKLPESRPAQCFPIVVCTDGEARPPELVCDGCLENWQKLDWRPHLCFVAWGQSLEACDRCEAVPAHPGVL